ncbi:flagellar biosynthesis anti-sigma factor FlgM [Gammaproteobacteria bacterium 53_120_T64]|nr:flagellar biosynthesis anti-sigma factor FlgM [Gammaproteobacteria bacterium 53_120_T64]
MDIRPTQGSTNGLNTNGGKKADASQGPSPEKAGTPQAGGESSTVTVTDSALKMLKIEQTLAEMPSFDAEKVARIKQALSDGSYTINTEQIADKLIKFEQDLA